jgi:formate/nitrite transporter FocA (FNT family)
MADQEKPQDQTQQKKDAEKEEADERSSPSGAVVYKAILKEGEDELKRPSTALFRSGLDDGMTISFTLIREGLLRAFLPEAHWRPAVAKLGYSVGFLIVVLGRQQLFTENTLTPILPLLKKKNFDVLVNVLRLWTIVLIANMIGALIVALVIAKTSVFDLHEKSTFLAIGHEALSPTGLKIMLRGIFAGWLISLMVWLLPFAEAARVWVIIIITYIVGLGHFSHIIAGAVEVFIVAGAGEAGWLDVIGHYLSPTLIGNILGGVTLVAAINHAQVVSGGHGEDV